MEIKMQVYAECKTQESTNLQTQEEGNDYLAPLSSGSPEGVDRTPRTARPVWSEDPVGWRRPHAALIQLCAAPICRITNRVACIRSSTWFMLQSVALEFGSVHP